jgi:hypothetical protein
LATRTAVVGWIASFLGTAAWVYGFYSVGHPGAIDWKSFAPDWIASYLPNMEAEVGMLMVIVGTVAIYWPSAPKDQIRH